MPKTDAPPPDEAPTKPERERTTYWMDFELKRAYEEAALEARRKGDKDFPATLNAFLDQAGRRELARLRQQRARSKK